MVATKTVLIAVGEQHLTMPDYLIKRVRIHPSWIFKVKILMKKMKD